jgi:isocitrate lyase
MLTFFLVGATVAHAQQLNPKNATPLQIIQQELAELQASLATLPPVHPKRAHYEPYEAYLIAIVADLQAGMGYHAAVVKNRPLMPEWVNIIPGAAPTKVTAITKEPTNRVKQQ